MPLSALQRSVVRTLAPFRSEHSFVGGGAALNRNWPRLSDDLDIFDDRVDLPASALKELQALRNDGFSVDVVVQNDLTVEAVVQQYGEQTRIQWFDDEETTRRFFKAIADEQLGFRLHQADNAVNKALCAARRNRAPRDAVDLINIVEQYAPLGPLVWAACGKDPALTPAKLLAGIRQNAFAYADIELGAVRVQGDNHFTQQGIRRILVPALEQARAYCDDQAPDDYLGFLFVNDREIPVAAVERDLIEGKVQAVPIKAFRATPAFPPG